ncbi:queosine biosynthesis [Candidatus Photodesmus katoptron]|uniref:7-carboxy-7-deazaguanine synthase n=1 Tax=Candidatus Photodesmus katoptron Akat1 TaxID=1236703 RepID=S3E084_9GAMM|nr:7-carboxy-7-deazaguanine synthase QueE [Candidatus Photodesmus katoptron]EPE37611.1 hypothetical protein O1U_0065 [Candidatus Photodesmus katoptron Akat1]KEY90670.1 queosine biosynthesis [Candidatus Photodesmus katoptron]
MYKVNDIFETIQGEGSLSGIPSVFVRLQGCTVGCSWCDTKDTWNVNFQNQCDLNEILNKTYPSESWCLSSAQEIIDVYRKRGFLAKHIVITGGEPCIYDLRPLLNGFEIIGCSCQIETSGTSEIRVSKRTWVTVSPKFLMKNKLPVLNSALYRADEIKYPVAVEKDIKKLDKLLSSIKISDKTIISLQPVSQKTHATELCIRTCIQRNWRLSIQSHKYLNIV